MPYTTPQGGFTEGLSGGLQLGTQFESIADKRLARQIQLKKFEQEQADRLSKLSDTLEARLVEATNEQDPNIRSAYVDTIFKTAEEQTGKKVGPVIRKFFKDPAQAKELMKAATDNGMSLMDVLEIQSNPWLLMPALGAMGRAKRQQQERNILGTTTSTLEPSQTAAAGPDAAMIAALQGRIADRKTGIANAVKAGASPEGLKALQAALQKDEDRLYDLTKTHGSAEINEAAKPISAEQYEKIANAFPELAKHRIIYPGMRYGDYLLAAKNALAPTGTSPTSGGQILAAEAASRRVVSPIGSPFGGPLGASIPTSPLSSTAPNPAQPIVRPLTPAPVITATPLAQSGDTTTTGPGALGEKEKIQFRQQAQFRQQSLPESLTRETGMTNYGQLTDAIAAGNVRPMSPVELARREQASRNIEHAYGKKFDDYQAKGELARIDRNYTEAMLAILDRAGTTGPWIAPVRTGINNLVQSLTGGLINPEGMTDMQLMNAFSTKMAIQDLQKVSGNDSDRDFTRALTSNPNVLNTPQANVAYLIYRNQLNKLDEHRAQMAQRWVDQFGSLSQTDPKNHNKSFDQVWMDWRSKPENSAVNMLVDAVGAKDLKDLYNRYGIPYRGRQ